MDREDIEEGDKNVEKMGTVRLEELHIKKWVE